MAISYKWCDAPMPDEKVEEQTKVYPKVAYNGTLNTAQLCAKMAAHTGFSVGEIKGVLSDFLTLCRQELSDGRTISIEGLGSFSPTLTTTDPVYKETLHKEHKVCWKGISYRPDKIVRRSMAEARLCLDKTSGCSSHFSDGEIEEKLKNYFAHNQFLDRNAFESLCGFLRSTATRRLRKLCQEGKLQNVGTLQHPIYIPAPCAL